MNKSFNSKTEGKLRWFIQKGDEIAIRTSKFTAERSNMDRNDNVKKSLSHVISYIGGMAATVHYYGSRPTGTSVGRSDLDFFIEVGDNFMLENTQEEATKILRRIKNAINKSDSWNVKLFLPDAKVPLLRVIYLRTNYECDITATSGISVCLCSILNHLISIQPQVVPLFHYIRIWLHLSGIKMKRYVQFLLVFFYLQRNNFMPSIKRIQQGIPSEKIGAWEVQFDPAKSLKSYSVNEITYFKNYITGYFKFYSKLDFEGLVLSTYSGKCVQRADVQSENFNINRPLCIAGPLDCGRNSGQFVGEKTMKLFQSICGLSYEFLMKNRC